MNRPPKYLGVVLLLVLLIAPYVPLSIPLHASTTYDDQTGDGNSVSVPERDGPWPSALSGVNNERFRQKIDPLIFNNTFLNSIRNIYSQVYAPTYKTLYGISTSNQYIGLFVKVDNEASLKQIERIVTKFEGQLVKYYPMIDWALLMVPLNKVQDAATMLSKLPIVKAVTLDSLKKPKMFDTSYLFNMPNIWNTLGYNGSGTLICILDTGVDPTHPAIPNPVYWRDFINGSSTPYDDHGHGTHVAGIAVGRGHSVFTSADAMYHAILVGESAIFEPPVNWANLTYQLDVSSYAGTNIMLTFEHFYNLYEDYSAYGYYFKAYAYVYVKFDAGSWTQVASYSGNLSSPTVEQITVSVPSGASTMKVSFVYDFIIQSNGSYYDFSEWDITGWFINNFTVRDATDPTIIYYDDPVTSDTFPPEVINHTYWAVTYDEFKGMAPGADLAVGKVCGPSGCPDSAILEGMNWSLTIGADVLSMSLGGPASVYDPLADMADYLVDNGVVVVIAAGNEGPDYYTVSSPGISHKAITVGAATKQDTLVWFSSVGPSPVDGWIKPDIVAVGYDLISSITSSAAEAPPWASSWPYVAWAGTSMATPMVSGLAALILSANPFLTPNQVKDIIVSSGKWLRGNPYLPFTDVYQEGGGIIDPNDALTTTVFPDPANQYLGIYWRGIDTSASFNITLTNIGSTDENVNVLNIFFYRLDIANETYEDYTSRVVSPVIGDTVTVPAGGSATVTVQLNLDPAGLKTGIYGGYIEFQYGSKTVHTIFGLNITKAVTLSGQVLDAIYGMPLEGINVSAFNSNFSVHYGSSITNATGEFSLQIPANATVRIIAWDDTGSYIGYMSYDYYATNNETGYTIKMFPAPLEPTALVFIDHTSLDYWDGWNITNSSNYIASVVEDMGINAVVWNASDTSIGSPYFAISWGYFPVIIYMAMGSYEPLFDFYDAEAMIYYATNYPGVILLSAGDLGYLWGNSIIMKKVAHALYLGDMDPGNYTIEIYNTTVTATLLGPSNFLSNYGSPPGTVIGTALVRDLGWWWYPDNVRPVTGAEAAAHWIGNDTAAVVFYGNSTEPAKTIYLAFELPQLNATLQRGIVERAVALFFDDGPPTVTGALSVEINGSNITFLPGTMSSVNISERFPYYYILDILHTANHTLAAELGAESLPITVDAATLGLAAEVDYTVDLTIFDILAHSTTASNAYIFKYLTGATGYSWITSTSSTFNSPLPGDGAAIYVDTTATTKVELVQVDPTLLPPLPHPYDTPYMMARMAAIDLSVYETTPGSTSEVTVTIIVPSYFNTARLDTTKIFWYNGTEWIPITNFTADPSNRTITITITQTSSPSISDLTGTPIILVFPITGVGGTLYSTPTPINLEVPLIMATTIVVLSLIIRRNKNK